MISQLDWLPTLLAAAVDRVVKERLLAGTWADGRSYKVHLDGYNFLPYFQGQAKAGQLLARSGAR